MLINKISIWIKALKNMAKTNQKKEKNIFKFSILPQQGEVHGN